MNNKYKFISFHGYFIRALYDWIVDNNLTPYIEVDTTIPHVRVPLQYIEDGRIILDITPRAINKLKIDNEAIEFEARFGGKICFLSIPLPAVVSIYSREYGRGIKFPPFLDIDANFLPHLTSSISSASAISTDVKPELSSPFVLSKGHQTLSQKTIEAFGSGATDVTKISDNAVGNDSVEMKIVGKSSVKPQLTLVKKKSAATVEVKDEKQNISDSACDSSLSDSDKDV